MEYICSQGKSPLSLGRGIFWSNGVGIQARWLSLATILYWIGGCVKDCNTLSCGLRANHSHLFHPVPLNVQGGLLRRVVSAGVKQFFEGRPELLTGLPFTLHNVVTPCPHGSPLVQTASGHNGLYSLLTSDKLQKINMLILKNLLNWSIPVILGY